MLRDQLPPGRQWPHDWPARAIGPLGAHQHALGATPIGTFRDDAETPQRPQALAARAARP